MKPYSAYPFRCFSGCIILLSLLWLMLGTSFIYVQQQKQLNNKSASKEGAKAPEKQADPFQNNTEENTEANSNVFAAEYLPESAEHLLCMGLALKQCRMHIVGSFIDFYGESVSPPPKAPVC